MDALRSQEIAVAAVFGVPGPLEGEYRARGCEINHLRHGQWLVGGNRLRRLRRWGREAKATWDFVRLYRRLRPGLVYVNTLMSVSAVLAARLSGIPVIWHIRELFEDVGGEMRWPFGGRSIVRSLVRRLPTRIVFISQAVKENVLGNEPCRKAQVIYNPLAASFFEHPSSASEARLKLGLRQDAFTVGLPGTLRPGKGHEFFVAVARRLLQKDKTYQFAISGAVDSSFATTVQQRCVALGIDQHVHFVGAISDMRLFYSACDLVCITSRAEPFGRTIIEAFAQRCPVIGVRSGGIPEAVVNEQTGLLVEYGDERQLFGAIQRLRKNARLRSTLRAAAWEAATLRYHENVYRDKMNSILSDSGPLS